MSTPSGAPHRTVRRRPAPVGPGTVVLTTITFLFIGWMITRGHSPHVAVLTAGSVLVVTTTLGRGTLASLRPFTARIGYLPPAPGGTWQETEQ